MTLFTGKAKNVFKHLAFLAQTKGSTKVSELKPGVVRFD